MCRAQLLGSPTKGKSTFALPASGRFQEWRSCFSTSETVAGIGVPLHRPLAGCSYLSSVSNTPHFHLAFCSTRHSYTLLSVHTVLIPHVHMQPRAHLTGGLNPDVQLATSQGSATALLSHLLPWLQNSRGTVCAPQAHQSSPGRAATLHARVLL